jgi:hypothetical protein
MSKSTLQYPPLPPDDLSRNLTLACPDTDQTLLHIGLVGDTYTITIQVKTPPVAFASWTCTFLRGAVRRHTAMILRDLHSA